MAKHHSKARVLGDFKALAREDQTDLFLTIMKHLHPLTDAETSRIDREMQSFVESNPVDPE